MTSSSATEPAAEDDGEEEVDVLICGAGSAGIGAARRLLGLDETDDGRRTSPPSVVALEARSRPGGRSWTSDALGCGVPLDHGGKWIHGATSPSNPMTAAAAGLGVATTAFDPRRRGGEGSGSSSSSSSSSDSDSSSSSSSSSDDEEDEEGIEEFANLILRDEAYREATAGYCTRRKRRRRAAYPTKVVIDGRAYDPDRRAERAGGLLFNLLCEDEWRGSLVEPAKGRLPESASFMDAIRLVAHEELPGGTFAEWLDWRAKNALESTGTELGGDGNEEEVRHLTEQTVALFRLRIYHDLENYEGCTLESISLRHGYEGQILPGPNAEVEVGYGGLVARLAEPVDVRLGHEVTRVDGRTDRDRFRVHCLKPDGSSKVFVARRVIVALPLGVLKEAIHGSFFDPPLPDLIAGPISRLEMCLMNKVELLFPRRWWPPGLAGLNIATRDDDLVGDQPWSHWFVESDEADCEGPAVIVCYASGMFAERVERMSDEEVMFESTELLRLAYGEDYGGIPDPTAVNVTKWRSDRHARGSWTVFNAGSRGVEDARAFWAHNRRRDGSAVDGGRWRRGVYFAGEHTCDNHVRGLDIGTVHGAYLSGRLVAEEVLRDLTARGEDDGLIDPV